MCIRDSSRRARTPLGALRDAGSVAETVGSLLGAQALVALVPMRVWRQWFEIGTQGEAANGLPDRIVARGVGLGRQVDRVADAFPWTIKCLPRALAASAMLSRRHIGSHLVIGARRAGGTGSVELHAWLTLAGACIVGRAERETYRAFVSANDALSAQDVGN